MTHSHLIKPLLNVDYPIVSYGRGIYLYDVEGKQYLDGSSGAVTCIIGHGVKEIIDTMKKQAEKVSFVYRSQFTNEPAEKLAEKLNDWTNGHFPWTFFVNSGSEATETAMKIAIQYWQEVGKPTKTHVISRFMSYHGITMGSLSLSGHTERRFRFAPLLEANPAVSPPYCYRCPFDKQYPDCQYMCATELERVVKRIGKDHIAAFIAEPIVGAAGGVIIPPKGYYQKIREICDRHEILFIADEVMTGIGRTGKRFALEHWLVQPDIIATGKGLGAGYTPIAATLVNAKVMFPIITGSGFIMSGHTYSANPQSTAIALSVLEYIEKHELLSNVKKVGPTLEKGLYNLKNKHTMIGDVRGIGLFYGIEFVSDSLYKIPFRKELNLTSLIVKRAQEKGLLIYPSQTGIEGDCGDAIIISPPLTINEKEIDQLLERLDDTLSDIERELQIVEIIPS
ncbi:aspartate aminotransferase family protein [Bacillus kexueae]|uniref:aspartate aminotransferase family protein n=1 Tax=Aeribacillus kexueae TaxID=2078952 RepID=UPI001FAF5B85|nr:aspartate aminotransferase family protein [Bacillus kexueae]